MLRDEDQEKWYLSIVDVIAVLTDSRKPQVDWSKMKKGKKIKKMKPLKIVTV